MEIKSNIEEIEKLIEKRANEKKKQDLDIKRFDVEQNYRKVNRKELIVCLEKIKKEIKKHYDKSIKLWNQATDNYFEYMRKHHGTSQLNPPPNKPDMPSEYDKANGYIDIYSIINENEILMKSSEVENMFLESMRGITKARNDAIGMEYYGLSNFSTNINGSSTSINGSSVNINGSTVESDSNTPSTTLPIS